MAEHSIDEINIRQISPLSEESEGRAGTPSGLPSDGSSDSLPEQLLSVDQVSQMMREDDADLLERMHADASRVSQYTSGRTPVLRPGEPKTLPPSDDSILLTPQSYSRQHYGEESSSGTQTGETHTRVVSFQGSSKIRNAAGSVLTDSTALPPLCLSHTQMGQICNHLGVLKEDFINCSYEGEIEQTDDTSISASMRYRRLLSGEIRTLEAREDKVPSADEEDVTTDASPIFIAEEVTSAALTLQQKKETGLAEQRMLKEAMQFAQAVGEDIALNRDGLRIIEDHTGEDASDDDDDGCKSKEVVVDDQEIIQDGMSSSQATLEMMNAHANQQDAQEGNVDAPLPSHVDIPQTRSSKRPIWPFGPGGSDYGRFLDTLSEEASGPVFVYKGICANPPEITKRGIQRGNYAQLHRKAWLEVSDKYHRYGKNLRLYYRYWERLGFPTNQFFDWLDSKGDAAGQPLPNLDECPRSVLDSDTVLYITNPEITDGYALDILCNDDGCARIIDVDGRPIATGSEGWIFVLRDGVMYGAEKITSISGHSKQRFHHSSFFCGKAVAAAGIIITDDQGYMTRLYPHSGHYRPGEAHMQRMLFFLHRKGVDLRTFDMDTQQFRHVARDKDAMKAKEDVEKKKAPKEGEKKKKIDSLHMEKAVTVACFLAHKASFIGQGIFDAIHKIRKADATSVSEALELVDNGGYWHLSKPQIPSSSYVTIAS